MGTSARHRSHASALVSGASGFMISCRRWRIAVETDAGFQLIRRPSANHVGAQELRRSPKQDAARPRPQSNRRHLVTRDKPEMQIIQFSQRHRDLPAAISRASDPGHPSATAMYFSEDVVQGRRCGSAIPLRFSPHQIGAAVYVGTFGSRAKDPPDLHPENGDSHPVIVRPLPYLCNHLLVALINPSESLKQIPILLAVGGTCHFGIRLHMFYTENMPQLLGPGQDG